VKKKGSNKIKSVNSKKNDVKKNKFIMKMLTFLGVLVFCFIIVYLMYHFFVEKSDLKINMSTDKQMETFTINGKEELIMTQKYMSDLGYSMRYDVNLFRVFKYKNQDIYKNLKDERFLIVVERTKLPTACESSTFENEYNNCFVSVDDYTEEYYISDAAYVYKVMVKKPPQADSQMIKFNVNYMIKNFVMTSN